MPKKSDLPFTLVILGPTGSGKTGVSLTLARMLAGSASVAGESNTSASESKRMQSPSEAETALPAGAPVSKSAKNSAGTELKIKNSDPVSVAKPQNNQKSLQLCFSGIKNAENKPKMPKNADFGRKLCLRGIKSGDLGQKLSDFGQKLPKKGYSGVEIISADSRAIFRGLDVGTAKPTPAERKIAPHWGLNLVEPGERFNVADWKTYAETKIREISARGNLPLVVGGTGLYIDALVFGYTFTESAQKNYSDRREMRENFLCIGVKTEREELRANLRKRIDEMFSPALFAETKELFAKFDKGKKNVFKSGTKINANRRNQALTADIYRYAYAYLSGEMTLPEAKQRTFRADWGLARRQLTWFRRNPEIVWLRREEIPGFVTELLADPH